MTPRVLVVDDHAEMRALLRDGLGRRGYEVRAAAGGDEALAALRGGEIDAVVTDVRMSEMNGLELCERIVANRADVPVIVITAFGSMDSAVAALRAGAFDYHVKPVELESLALALERALRHRALADEVKRLRQIVAAPGRFEGLIGGSVPMQRLYDSLVRIAASDASVVISGETGSGKELVARALHRRGPRAGGPFVAINCAAMPEALLESELFGHVRGAFTDARAAKVGLMVRAHGGTLLLDEIGDMPPSLQPKLLRALQERRVRPVGATEEVAFDARVIASTHRDLEELVASGQFREDLYYRLDVISLRVPPLRSRGDDILLLAHAFLRERGAAAGKKISGVSAAAAERLLAYEWPGNVRELENVIAHAVALAEHDVVTVDDLPEKLRRYRRWRQAMTSDPETLLSVREVERLYIEHVLSTVGGNKRRAARILGVDRATLYRKLDRYAADDD